MWRVGRKVGRTIYDKDELIGVMDSTLLAERVVNCVNDHDRQHRDAVQEILRPMHYQISALKEENANLREALRNSPKIHAPTCKIFVSYFDQCNCGTSDWLDRYRALLDGAQ